MKFLCPKMHIAASCYSLVHGSKVIRQAMLSPRTLAYVSELPRPGGVTMALIFMVA